MMEKGRVIFERANEAMGAGFQVPQRGGILFKLLANVHFDAACSAGIMMTPSSMAATNWG